MGRFWRRTKEWLQDKADDPFLDTVGDFIEKNPYAGAVEILHEAIPGEQPLLEFVEKVLDENIPGNSAKSKLAYGAREFNGYLDLVGLGRFALDTENPLGDIIQRAAEVARWVGDSDDETILEFGRVLSELVGGNFTDVAQVMGFLTSLVSAEDAWGFVKSWTTGNGSTAGPGGAVVPYEQPTGDYTDIVALTGDNVDLSPLEHCNVVAREQNTVCAGLNAEFKMAMEAIGCTGVSCVTPENPGCVAPGGACGYKAVAPEWSNVGGVKPVAVKANCSRRIKY